VNVPHSRRREGRKPRLGNVVRNTDGELGVVIDCWPLDGGLGAIVRWEPLQDGRITRHEPPDDLAIVLLPGEE
jgi:hypothetical protein